MTALQLTNPAIAVMPTPQEWNIIKEQANVLVKSGFLPDAIKTAEQAIAIALKGREIGVPMMQAFSHIVIIKGKPTMSAELMLGQIFRLCPDAKIEFLEMTTKVCRIRASRRNSPAFEFKFDWDDAVTADLATKDNWRKWPRAMLRSRCISEMARSMFSDALMGVSYTPEELDPDNVHMSEDGEVIDITPTSKVTPSKAEELPKPAPTIEADFEGVDEALKAHSPAPSNLPRNADYKIPVGREFKGKTLADVPVDKLTKDVFWWQANGKVPAAKEYVQKATEFLADLKPGDGAF